MKLAWAWLLRRLGNPAIYTGMLLAAVVVVACYQVCPSYDVQIGSPTDVPYVYGFNGRETTGSANEIPFRWTTASSLITFNDVGRQDFDVTLTIKGDRPASQPPAKVQVNSGATEVAELAPTAETRDYTFHVPRESVQDSTLRLSLLTNAFKTASDPREHGVLLMRVKVTPGSAPDRFIEPPLRVVYWVASAVGLLGVILSLLGWGIGGVAVGTSLLALFAGGLLVFDRVWLTAAHWYSTWPQVLIAGGIVLLLVRFPGGLFLRWGGVRWTALERRLLLTMLLAAFAIKLAGQLHPEIFVVDLNFHVHNLQRVENGVLLFKWVSSEYGGQEAYYLPTTYLFMMPLDWLLRDTGLTVHLFTMAESVLGCVVVFYLVRRLAGDSRGALLASALYLSLPIAILPASWGLSTNLFGDLFALTSVAVAAGAYPDMRPNRPAFWVLVFTIAITLLSHAAVFLLAVVALVAAAALWLLARRRVGIPSSAGWTFAALALSGVIALVVYYYNFVPDALASLGNIFKERTAEAAQNRPQYQIGGAVADRSLGLTLAIVSTRWEWFWGGLRGLWQEVVAYYRAWPLAGATLAFVALWPRRSPGCPDTIWTRRSRLVLSAAGWGLSVVFFALVGWVLNLYVRYALFALPIVAMGVGVLLSRLSLRHPVGRYLSAAVVIFFVFQALVLWEYRIDYALK